MTCICTYDHVLDSLHLASWHAVQQSIKVHPSPHQPHLEEGPPLPIPLPPVSQQLQALILRTHATPLGSDLQQV